MPKELTRYLAATLVGAFLLSQTCLTLAADIVINTDTGVITVDGAPVTSLNGTSFTSASPTGGIRKFFFAGDLNIGATDTVTGIGSNAASFVVGNNANIDPGATFNFSAIGQTPGAGGGSGGAGGAGHGAAGQDAR